MCACLRIFQFVHYSFQFGPHHQNYSWINNLCKLTHLFTRCQFYSLSMIRNVGNSFRTFGSSWGAFDTPIKAQPMFGEPCEAWRLCSLALKQISQRPVCEGCKHAKQKHDTGRQRHTKVSVEQVHTHMISRCLSWIAHSSPAWPAVYSGLGEEQSRIEPKLHYPTLHSEPTFETAPRCFARGRCSSKRTAYRDYYSNWRSSVVGTHKPNEVLLWFTSSLSFFLVADNRLSPNEALEFDSRCNHWCKSNENEVHLDAMVCWS